jgi:nucleotide-binding universal stress UspA family protein
VVAHAPCSVLLAPKDGQPWSKRVLVAIDPQAPETLQRQIAATAAAVAGECGLPLSVVCVADAAGSGAADGALARALDAARAHGVAATGETRSGKPFEQIIAAADALGADLLVVGRHGEALGGRAWLGSTTQKVIGLSERPVLVALPKSAAA